MKPFAPILVIMLGAVIVACRPSPTGVLPATSTPLSLASLTSVPTVAPHASAISTIEQVAEARLEPTVVDFPDARSVSVATVPDGTVYAALGQADTIFVVRSTNGGTSFEPPVRASVDAPATVLEIERPAIVADAEGRVSVGWLQAEAGLPWYARSDDGGQTFGPSRQVTLAHRPHATLLGMAMDDAHQPVLAWLEGHGMIAVARSQDDGLSFPGARMVESEVCDCCQPQPIVVEDQLLVAYRNVEAGDNGEDVRNIYLLRSEDGGATFNEVQVSDAPWYFPACPISGPSVASDGETLYVSWMDGRNDARGDLSETDIWIAASSDGGRSFAPNRRINPESERGYFNNLPSLVAEPNGTLHVVWERDEGNRFVLLYASSEDGGESWTVPQVVIRSDDGSERGRPQYATLTTSGDDRLHMSWVDNLGAHLATWAPE